MSLLNHKAARELALSTCREFGIPATFVRKSYLRHVEEQLRNYIRSTAPASVGDGKKSVK